MKTQPKQTIEEKIKEVFFETCGFCLDEGVGKMKKVISDLLDTLPMEELSPFARWSGGYNKHVAEVRQWKKEIDEELK